MNLQELIEKRAKLVADMRALRDGAKDGVLTAEEETRWNAIDADQEIIGNQIEKEMRLRDLEQKLLEPTTRKAPINAGGTGGATPGQVEKEAELRMKLFRAYLSHGSHVMHSDEYRSLAAGALTEGGAFIPPQQFIADVIKAVDDSVYMMQIATVFKLQGSSSLGFPVLDADPADADWTTELATGSLDTTMATGLRELKPLPIAKRFKLSRKLISNSAVPVESLVLQRLAYKFGITLEKGFLTGNGATAPLGIFTASANGVPTSRDVSTDNTTSAVTVDGLINALFSLKEAYMSKASWIFHRDTVKMIRKLKTSQGVYLWQPTMEAGRPNTILDRPYYMSEYAPNTFTTGLYVGAVGDFKQYYIAEVVGQMEVQRLNELYAEANQVGYIGRMEADGMPVLAEAFARVKLA